MFFLGKDTKVSSLKNTAKNLPNIQTIFYFFFLILKNLTSNNLFTLMQLFLKS